MLSGGEPPLFTKKMTYSTMKNSTGLLKKTKQIGTVFFLAFASCVIGINATTSSAEASYGYGVYGPNGSYSYCTSYGDTVFCS